MKSVFHASFLLFHFGLGGRADIDNRHAAGQLGQTFLQLLAVVIGGGVFNLFANLTDTGLDVLGVTAAFNDRGVVFVHRDFLGSTEIGQHGVLELETKLFGDNLTTGQNGDIFQHGLAAVAEARSLDGTDLDGTAQLVDNQRRQSFTLDILSNNHQRFAALSNLFQNRQKVFHAADLLVVDENHGVFQNRLHGVGIGHEIR